MITPENLDMAIEVIKGAERALDLVGRDLGELENTELFKALTDHNIAQITSDASSYLETLEQVKALMNKNGGELPADDPSIKQQLVKASIIGQGYGDGEDGEDGDGDFRSALAGVFGGYNFL